MKGIFIEDLREGEGIVSCFLLKAKRLAMARNGDIFLALTLTDKTGELKGYLWENPEEHEAKLALGDLVWVEGEARALNGGLILKIIGVEKAGPNEVGLLPGPPEKSEEMMERLLCLTQRIKDSALEKLVSMFLSDSEFSRRFALVPAGLTMHHAYPGGLLEHTVGVMKTCFHLIKKCRGPLNEDLLLAGALLHDVGKVKEFDQRLSGGYTVEGSLLGHPFLGAEIVGKKISLISDFPPQLAVDLKHLILTHHEKSGHGGPRAPSTKEAVILHRADSLDAEINRLCSGTDSLISGSRRNQGSPLA